jgi:GAF domain-containing protein
MFFVLPLAYGLFRLVSDPSLFILVPVLGFCLISLWVVFLNRKGYVQWAAWLLISMTWVALLAISWNLGGVRDASYAALMVSIAMAGLLFGGRESLAVAVLSILAGLAMADAEQRGMLPIDPDTPFDVVISYGAIFLLMVSIVHASSRGYRYLLSQMQETERDVRARNWELQQMRDSLEERVAERTSDLERRSRYLEAAAQVAYVAGEYTNIEELVRESVDLIQEQFELYYVGLFIVDPTGEWAVLRGGTGEAGMRMLQREHRIRVGEGMIGWSIEHNQSRFAQQAEADQVRLATPELAETRAEAALPLRARGQVVGALTVQSTKPDFFDEPTVTVLQTMADLVAIAIDNAELFAENEQALAAVRRAYGEISAEAWERLLRRRGSWGYHYDGARVFPIKDNWSAETTQAIQEAQPIDDQDASERCLALPIQVGSKVIGAISFRRKDEDGDWDEAQVDLLQSLTDRLGQALDSARLLNESRRRAAREERMNQIAARLANAVDVDAMLRATVRELGSMPGVLEASVHMDVSDQQTMDME